MTRLDGPRRAPRSGGPADSLVALIHGYGANGEDLIGLADAWSARLPRTAFVAPDAPEELQAAFGGRQWFALTLRDPTEYRRGVIAAGPALEAFLDAELARLRLPPDRLMLVGFSQGTMMALHVGLRRRVAPAAIVGYSGLLAGPEHLAEELACRPPVMLVHGSDDGVIAVGALHTAREWLAAVGLPVSWHVQPGLGHGIDQRGLELGAAFLAEAIRRR